MKNWGRKLLSVGLGLTMMSSCVSINYTAVCIEEASQTYNNDELLEKLASAKKDAATAKRRLQNCLRYPDCRKQLKCLEGDQKACNSIDSDKDFLYAKGALGVIGWNAANQLFCWVVNGALGLVKGAGRQVVRVFVRR